MSQEPHTDSDQDAGEAEVVDGLPVIVAETRVLEVQPPAVTARQATALAATGFVAGACTVAVVNRRRARVPRRKRKRKGALGEIVSSNSFLVDVHLLRRD